MKIGFTLLTSTARPPQRMTEHSSGWDLSADMGSPIRLEPHTWQAVPTGLALEIPVGWEGQVRPRSGLALNKGLGVLNAPGTIDADYRGEVKVILINHSDEVVSIDPGMRIAQLVICPVCLEDFEQRDSLGSSDRSGGGFGHTGS